MERTLSKQNKRINRIGEREMSKQKNKRCGNCQELYLLERFCKRCNDILKAEHDQEFTKEDGVKFYETCNWCFPCNHHTKEQKNEI